MNALSVSSRGTHHRQVTVVLRGFELPGQLHTKLTLKHSDYAERGTNSCGRTHTSRERNVADQRDNQGQAKERRKQDQDVKFDDLHEEDEKNIRLTVYAGNPIC